MIQNALFLSVICAVVFVFYLPSYVKMQDLHEKNRVYEQRIHQLEKDNVSLKDERRRLTEDPSYFEKVAREKMGIIRDGEVIYKVVGPGQKKDGKVSEEASFIVKQEPEDGSVKPQTADKTAVKPIVAAASAKTVKKNAVSTKSSKSIKSTKSTKSKKSSETKKAATRLKSKAADSDSD